jgi:hypothetical protein
MQRHQIGIHCSKEADGLWSIREARWNLPSCILLCNLMESEQQWRNNGGPTDRQFFYVLPQVRWCPEWRAGDVVPDSSYFERTASMVHASNSIYNWFLSCWNRFLYIIYMPFFRLVVFFAYVNRGQGTIPLYVGIKPKCVIHKYTIIKNLRVSQ